MDEESAKRRGRLIHRLLEYLPDIPEERWEETAGALLRSAPDAADEAEHQALFEEAARCIRALPDIFEAGALTEVDIVGFLDSLDRRMAGTVDRLIISDDEVHIIDFKTNAVRPQTAESCPEGVLRQMGAYLAAAQSIWPSKRVQLTIVWTVDATAIAIPHNIVINALRRATSS